MKTIEERLLRELQVQLVETKQRIEEAHQALFKFVEEHLSGGNTIQEPDHGT